MDKPVELSPVRSGLRAWQRSMAARMQSEVSLKMAASSRWTSPSPIRYPKTRAMPQLAMKSGMTAQAPSAFSEMGP